MTDSVNNPHDKFFKSVFSQRENARSFIESYLPQDIIRCLQLDTLDLEKDTFIEPKLKEYFSDLLYQIQLSSGDEHHDYQMVDINHLEALKPRSMGAETLAYHALTQLQLDKKLTALGFEGSTLEKMITHLVGLDLPQTL